LLRKGKRVVAFIIVNFNPFNYKGMKKLLIVFAVVLGAAGIYSFSANSGNTPESIALSSLNAFFAQDFKKAKEFETSNSQGVPDFMITLTQGEEIKGNQREVKNMKCILESDSSAVCGYTNLDKDTDSESIETVKTVKEEGKLLVGQIKEDPPETEK